MNEIIIIIIIILIIIMFIVSNNINSCTYNQSADQLLSTFKTMENKQIGHGKTTKKTRLIQNMREIS